MKRLPREMSVFNISAVDLFASALGAFILLTVVMLPFFPKIGRSGAARGQEPSPPPVLPSGDGGASVIADLRDALAIQRSREGYLVETVGALRSEVAERDARLAEMAAGDADLAALQARVSSLQRTVSERDDEIRSLAAAGSEEDALRAEIDDLTAQLADQTRRVGEQEAEIAGLARRKFLLVTISWDGIPEDDVDLHVVDPAGNTYSWRERSHSGSAAVLEEDSQHGPGNEVWFEPVVKAGWYEIRYVGFFLRSQSVTVRGQAVHSDRRAELPSRLVTDEGVSSSILAARLFINDQGELQHVVAD